MINEQLKNLGLTAAEIEVYNNLLQIGLSTVQDISAATKINRSTTYTILDSLLEKGLIFLEKTMSGRGKNIRKYGSYEPEVLIRKVAKLEKEQKELQQEIETALPNLFSLAKNNNHKPRVSFFEGKEGVKNIEQNIFSEKNTNDTLRKIAFAGSAQFVTNEDKSLKLLTKSIVDLGTNRDKHILESLIKGGSLNIYINSNKDHSESSLKIFNNKIALTSNEDEFGVIVENEEISKIMKELFDLAWEEAKRIDAELRSGQKTTLRVKTKKLEKKPKK